MDVYKRSRNVLLGVLIVYALLVATHRGEFWPFSIYPMFSRGGQPFSRVVVRQVPLPSTRAGTARWRPRSFNAPPMADDALPGRPFALKPRGINPIDLAGFISKTTTWDAERRATLRRLLGSASAAQPLLILRMNGRLQKTARGDPVAVEAIPYLLLRPDTMLLLE